MDAVIRFQGQPRGKRVDSKNALTALITHGFRRREMIRFHTLQDGTGEQCTWRYEHPETGESATLRIFYPAGQED